MALFEWNDSYSVNVKKIDLEHLKLVEMINDLYRALLSSEPPDILDNILNRMVEYAAVHFENEEALMERHGYPLLGVHKKEHETFVEKLIEYLKKRKNGELTLSVAIPRFLKEWLIGHIAGSDKECARFLNQAGVN